MTSAAVLAIDAGNSKTDVALVAASGEVLSWVRGGGFHPYGTNLPTAIDGVEDLVRRATVLAGAGSGPVAEHVAAYLAHCDLPVEQQRLHAAIAARGWGPSVTVDNDTFAILRAGSPMPYGVAVVCGAGMNCVALSPSGQTSRYLALGRRSGDWGGGEFLGEEVLWRAIRAEDGRGRDTALRDAVTSHFGRRDVAAVCVAFHLGELSEDRLHEIVPLLFTIADAGDTVAADIVEQLGAEVTLMAMAAQRRLDFAGHRVPLVLGGGVLQAANPRLMGHIAKNFADVGADFDLRILADPPLVGAALHGLDRLGGPPAVELRLRTDLAAVTPQYVGRDSPRLPP